MVSLGRLSRPFFCCRHARTLRAASAGTSPGRRPDAWCSLTLRPGLKGMRGWLAAARLACRCAAAPLSALRACGRSGGPRPLRRVAAAPGGSPRRSGLLAAPASRLLRFAPAAVAAPLRGSPLRSCPGAPWVAALPVRSLGGAVAVARRARAAAPPSLRSVARVAPADPARPPRGSVPACAPAGGAARPAAAGCLVGVPPPRVLSGSCGRRGVPRLRARGVPPAAAGGKRWDFDFPLSLKIQSP